jgi:hypothetical protein
VTGTPKGAPRKQPEGNHHVKALIGFALVVGDVILIRAVTNTFRAHQLHGAALAVYVVAVLVSIALWGWVLRRKPAKPAARPYVPYGGGR